MHRHVLAVRPSLADLRVGEQDGRSPTQTDPCESIPFLVPAIDDQGEPGIRLDQAFDRIPRLRRLSDKERQGRKEIGKS